MNVNEPKGFAGALKALARLLASGRESWSAKQMEQVATIFERSPEKTTSATIKKLSDFATADEGASDLVMASGVLREASTFAEAISGAKFAGLIASLLPILELNAAASMDGFAAGAIAKLNAPKSGGRRDAIVATPIREDFVRAYVRRLEEHLGDEGFVAVHRELEKAGSRDEIIAIAKQFTTEKPRSGPKALQAIWNRHHTLMSFRAKSESRAGRSAA